MERRKKYVQANHDIDASFLSLEMWARPGDPRIKKQIGMNRPEAIIEIVNGSIINYFFEADKFFVFADACFRAIYNNKKFLPHLQKRTEIICRKIRNIAEKYVFQIEELSEKDLQGIVAELGRLQYECVVFGTVVAFADIQGKVSNELAKIVSKRRNLSFPEHIYSNILGSPKEKGMAGRAIDEIRRRKSKIELMKKYFWLNQGYVGRGLTIKEIDIIKKEKKEHLETHSRKKLLSELKLNEKEKMAFKISRDIIYTKSLRTDSRQFAYVVINRIVDRLARISKTDPGDIESLSEKEFLNFINKKSGMPQNIKERRNRGLMIPQGKNDYRVLVGMEAEKFLEENVVREEVGKRGVVTGQVAYFGKVRGKVKLVFGPQHIGKVKKRDILISIATSPQLLPAMQLAAAYVTDVGGITSHAAIVSRELKKPCVVGTRHATQVFKDGDLVEVDAGKGIVKILKKAK